jgi:hypothetical protein
MICREPTSIEKQGSFPVALLLSFTTLLFLLMVLSELFWKLKRAIDLVSYGDLRPCLCTPCEWPDDGSFSYNTPVFHTNCVLYRKQQHTNNITKQLRDSRNH